MNPICDKCPLWAPKILEGIFWAEDPRVYSTFFYHQEKSFHNLAAMPLG
jgi:hypothetical protein